MEPKTPVKAQPYGAEDDYYTFFNAVTAVPSGATNTSSAATVKAGVKSGSIMISTSSDFVGTTSSMALQGSNDNSTWAAVLQDDNSTAMSFTLGASSSTYTFLLKRVLFKFYRLVYTKGDASAGTYTANYVGKI